MPSIHLSLSNFLPLFIPTIKPHSPILFVITLSAFLMAMWSLANRSKAITLNSRRVALCFLGLTNQSSASLHQSSSSSSSLMPVVESCTEGPKSSSFLCKIRSAGFSSFSCHESTKAQTQLLDQNYISEDDENQVSDLLLQVFLGNTSHFIKDGVFFS